MEAMEGIEFGIDLEGRTAGSADGLGVGWERRIKDDQEFGQEKLGEGRCHLLR